MKKTLRNLVLAGILALSGVGCTDKGRSLDLDLNGDGKVDKVWLGKTEQHCGYRDFDIIVRFNLGNDKYSHPFRIARFKDRPSNLFFYDIDSDGDLDLVYSKEHTTTTRSSMQTYVKKNNGRGHFGKAEKIASF